MKNFKLISTIFVSFLFVSFFVFLSISFFFITQTPIDEESNGSHEQVYEYKYYQYNTKSEESAFGLVSIFEQLGEDEQIFHKDLDSGQLSLISNFESKQFKCTGTCICENDDDDRRSSVASAITTRSITFLVAGLASYIALEKAKEYFFHECKEYLSDETCSEIKSKVNVCTESFEKEEEETTETKKDDDNPSTSNTHSERTYLCTGKCIKSQNIKQGSKFEDLERFANFRCEDLSAEKEVKITEQPGSNEVFLLESLFTEKKLHPFCVRESMARVWHIPQTKLTGVMGDMIGITPKDQQQEGSWKEMNVCIGQAAYSGIKNPFVHCVRTN